MIILASVGVFGTRMTPLGMAGSGIAVAGAFLYALAKQFSAKPKKPQLREVPLLFLASSQQFPANNSTSRISAFFYTLHFVKIIIMKILRGFLHGSTKGGIWAVKEEYYRGSDKHTLFVTSTFAGSFSILSKPIFLRKHIFAVSDLQDLHIFASL